MSFRVLLLLCIALLAAICRATDTFYVCEAGDSNFLGTYTRSASETSDGVAVFTNENEMSIFRSKKFWYIGDLTNWPPVTHYRCVEPEGCGYDKSDPPTAEEGAWKVGRDGKDPVPAIQSSPCTKSGDEL